MRGYGLRILERNWQCRLGEIDLIAEEGATLVFAEVRLRNDRMFGGAGESITAAKRFRIIAAAQFYLTRRRAQSCRFDVLLVTGNPARVEWIRNAFAE